MVIRLLYTGSLNINKTSYWYDVTYDGNCPRITKLVKKTTKLPFSAFYNVIYQNLFRKFVYIAVIYYKLLFINFVKNRCISPLNNARRLLAVTGEEHLEIISELIERIVIEID